MRAVCEVGVWYVVCDGSGGVYVGGVGLEVVCECEGSGGKCVCVCV